MNHFLELQMGPELTIHSDCGMFLFMVHTANKGIKYGPDDTVAEQ